MTEYVSRERVYELGPDGQPHRLKYPVGYPIPEDEAIRQGIIPDPAGADEPAAKRRTPAQNKRRTPAANKSHPTPKET